ncbi:PREDICTED: uncharacterized protein LOC104816989 [Tarenaya hassleriana]|uniref:uncharacterized protein LOC104816989 n=1 Tax=Tarenaya hassleriana TaxID=28532 RepID=UPI00053CA4CE|nr:PREDICTED: uncharacterized protein LOC104816989 [Tarenaya hassleriana]
MEGPRKDLLELELNNNSPSSAIESALLVCKNKKSSSLPCPPLPDSKPHISPLPKSQFLDRVKGFLGVIAESNKRLEIEAKDNSEAVDIEALTGNESEVIEMDLMLGVADLNTPEAVNAAEAAIAGNRPLVHLPAGSSDSESDEEEEEEEDDERIEKKSSEGESNGKGKSRKRPKIEELS